MIEQFVIFSKSGVILWKKTLSNFQGNPINDLIHNVLLEDRTGDKQYSSDIYTLRWSLDNKRGLVYVVVYQKVFQLLYIEKLLEKVKHEFNLQFKNEIESTLQCSSFIETFDKILRYVEEDALASKTNRIQRTFHQTKKGKSQNKSGNTNKETENISEGDPVKNPHDSAFESLKREYESRGKLKAMKSGPRQRNKKTNQVIDSKSKKKMTKWDDGKLTRAEVDALDHSKEHDNSAESGKLEEMRRTYIGDENYDMDDESECDESDESDESESSTLGGGGISSESDTGSSWSFKKTSIGNFFQSISGNKILEREDLTSVVDQMRTMLISKNVASEVADEVCESIITTLVGQRLESFTRVSTVVRKAIEDALLRILTPKKSTDVLREVLAANAAGRPYTIVFVGVNGVGKSTSLSKVCYYLKSKGIKVLIAACDTFRSGAVEQLSQHAKVLDVPLFDRGYAKDPSLVARDAVTHAADRGYDCVLIDTAGRMQNNEPLMRALAKLVSSNDPDLVLFVGEALVGNDGIDQLHLFDRALADFSDKQKPHRVDGIILTKFDTIDDKVGAAVSMVYKTGQPIMFVGTGQKYTNLKKLNVRTVLRCLLN